MPKVSINIVAWNSMKYLPELMRSIREQTFRDFSVLVIDNASTDGVVDFLREEYPEVTVLRNFNNTGFAPAHNQGIKYAMSNWRNEPLAERYVLVTNPDIIFTPKFLETLVARADAAPSTASFGGKLLRVMRQGEGELIETVRTDVIDSTGLRIMRNRRSVDRGQGEHDTGQYDRDTDIFGVSGALVLYRASSLDAVRVGEEYFDHDFFAYKEDTDLAWRFQLQGLGSLFVPEAVAYHFRRAGGKEKAGPFEMLRNRKTKSPFINYLSQRNHPLMLVKNEHFTNLLLHAPWIVPYELAKFFSILILEPRTLRAVKDFWKYLPRMLEKRRTVMAKCRVSASQMRKWFM